MKIELIVSLIPSSEQSQTFETRKQMIIKFFEVLKVQILVLQSFDK